ncbi:MAG: glycosyltransferase family 2 protein [Bacteroidetes bacterium]|nr:glycosyltransferase family 2 protein [Bacteroidota bacterium]
MLSIVLPAYHEEDNIRYMYREILKHVSQSSSFEIIFVDDGSRDRTFEKIRELATEDQRVRGIRLSRNFGHQTALLAGLQDAGGELVIMMDADGQHPPALIPELLKKMEEGYDIVNTIRKETEGAGALKKISSRWFYRVFNALSDVKIEPSAADFRIVNRKALEAFLSIEEQDRFTRGLVTWIGFKQAYINYKAEKRQSGASKYTLRRMRIFAVDGVTSFSSRPLRLSTTLGFITMLAGILYSVYAIVMNLLGNTNPGWTSLLLTILFLGGIQLISIGILGEYLARIYNETKRRPHFFIQERTRD